MISYITTSSKFDNREIELLQNEIERAKREITYPRKKVYLRYLIKYNYFRCTLKYDLGWWYIENKRSI